MFNVLCEYKTKCFLDKKERERTINWSVNKQTKHDSEQNQVSSFSKIIQTEICFDFTFICSNLAEKNDENFFWIVHVVYHFYSSTI